MNKSTDRVISYIFAALILVGIPANILGNRFYDSSWTVGEWLISYEGGFVRRGLPGAVLHGLASNFTLSPIVLIWLANAFFYALLSYLLFRFCKGRIQATILLSPMILLAPVIGNFFIRKDVMAASLYGLSLLAVWELKGNSRPDLLRAISVNVFSIIAILSHESYGFWALPSLFVILFLAKDSPQELRRNALYKSLLTLLPAIAIFVLCLSFKGTALEALSIHRSWQGLDELLPSRGALSALAPIGAIDAIGWTTNQGLRLSLSTLNDINYAIWIPAAWMLTIYTCINIFIGEGNDVLAAKRRAIVLFQFLTVSPLFVLGWDFGRWIFLWLTSSALLYGLCCSACIAAFERPPLIQENLGVILARLTPGFELKGRSRLALLFLGIPGCCWSLKSFLMSTPVGYSLSLAKQILEKLT